MKGVEKMRSMKILIVTMVLCLSLVSTAHAWRFTPGNDPTRPDADEVWFTGGISDVWDLATNWSSAVEVNGANVYSPLGYVPYAEDCDFDPTYPANGSHDREYDEAIIMANVTVGALSDPNDRLFLLKSIGYKTAKDSVGGGTYTETHSGDLDAVAWRGTKQNADTYIFNWTAGDLRVWAYANPVYATGADAEANFSGGTWTVGMNPENSASSFAIGDTGDADAGLNMSGTAILYDRDLGGGLAEWAGYIDGGRVDAPVAGFEIHTSIVQIQLEEERYQQQQDGLAGNNEALENAKVEQTSGCKRLTRSSSRPGWRSDRSA